MKAWFKMRALLVGVLAGVFFAGFAPVSHAAAAKKPGKKVVLKSKAVANPARPPMKVLVK